MSMNDNLVLNINNIHFTNRELDIIACLLAGRSNKKISSILSISTKTVENHIYNVMSKAGQNSREKIIDFIEQSRQFNLIKQHYLNILKKYVFEQQLKKLLPYIKATNISCLIYYYGTQKVITSFITQLEQYLNALKINTFCEIWKDNKLEQLINKIKNKKIDYIIYVISNELAEQLVTGKHDIQKEIYNLIPEINNSNPIIGLLLNDTIPLELEKTSSNFITISLIEQKNLYYIVFELFKIILPIKNIDNYIVAFKKQYEILHDNYHLPIQSTQIQEKKLLEINNSNNNNNIITKNNCKKYFYVLVITIIALIFNPVVNNLKKKIQRSILSKQVSHKKILTWNLPRQDHLFIGRSDLLKQLHNKLNIKKSMVILPEFKKNMLAISALTGLGGIGKTQLALQYIHHTTQPYSLKIWFPAENIKQLKQKYIEFSKEIGFAEENSTIEKAISYTNKWLVNNPGWLIVFDNVNSYEDIKQFLPNNTAGFVILTSRNQNWPDKFHVLSIDVMTEKEALFLVNALINRDLKTDEEEKKIKILCNRLGYLPLALAQISAYIRNTNISIDKYLSLYDEYEHKLVSNIKFAGNIHKLLTVTWDISLGAVEKEIEDKDYKFLAKTLLTVCSYLHADHIPRSSLLIFLQNNYPKILNPEILLDHLLSLLRKYSLITLDQETISIHRLIQSVFRYKHANTTNYVSSLNQQWYNKILEAIDLDFWRKTKMVNDEKRQKSLFPHLQNLVEYHKQLWPNTTNKHYAFALTDIGWIIQHHLFNAKDAKDFFELSLAILKKNTPTDKDRIGKILSALGIMYRELGIPSRSIIFLQQSLAMKESFHGKNDIEVAAVLNSMGITYTDMEKAIDAKNCLERALKIKQLVYGENHVDVAKTLTNLAVAYQKMKQLELAKNILERSLKIEISGYGGENHVYVGKTLHYLGSVYLHLGNTVKAKFFLEKALHIREMTYNNKDHINVSKTLDELGMLYKVSGNIKQAKISWQRSLLIKEQHYSSNNHIEIAKIRRLLDSLNVKD